MGILAADRYVQRGSQGLGKGPEEMGHEFGRQLADALAVEPPAPHEIGPAGNVEGHLRLGLVHREQKPVARDAALVAQRLAQRSAQGERAVLDGVVFVYLKIALARYIQRESAMPRDLLQHVIEETQAGADGAWAFAGQVQFDDDVGFLGRPPDARAPRRAQDALHDSASVPWALTRMPSIPRPAANSRSVSRSPTMKLCALSMGLACTNLSTMPVFGLRQAHSSRLKCGQTNTSSKVTPWDANSARMN